MLEWRHGEPPRVDVDQTLPRYAIECGRPQMLFSHQDCCPRESSHLLSKRRAVSRVAFAGIGPRAFGWARHGLREAPLSGRARSTAPGLSVQRSTRAQNILLSA